MFDRYRNNAETQYSTPQDCGRGPFRRRGSPRHWPEQGAGAGEPRGFRGRGFGGFAASRGGHRGGPVSFVPPFGFGGPFGPGAPGGPGGPGRRRGLFDGVELRLLLLDLIAEQPRHGYDLIRVLEERTGGTYSPSPGMVYPILTMLQDMGYIAEAATEGARKAYTVTPEGTAYLEQNRAQADALKLRARELGTSQREKDRSPVRRAVQNLLTALHERMSREGEDSDLVHRIAALLDEVTQKIERS